MNKKKVMIAALLIPAVLFAAAGAAPPPKYTIEGIKTSDIALARNRFINMHDKDTEKRQHLAFVECVNAILEKYGEQYRLPYMHDDGSEVTVSKYLDLLEVQGIGLYRMRGLKGKVLRSIVCNDIPVLLLGQMIIPNRGVHFANTDVAYLYREPDFTQGTRKLDDDIVFRFKTARGGQLDCREFYDPGMVVDYNSQHNAAGSNPSVTWVSVESEYSGFENYIVITTKDKGLKTIKKSLNATLNDVDFKYQLPDFKQIKGADIDW